MRRSLRRALARVALAVSMTAASMAAIAPLAGAAEASCSQPESDAEALVILHDYYRDKYWWDHADLTAYIQAHPSTKPAQVNAVSRSISTWDTVLRDCFDDVITLTQVTSRRKADIVLHFVPRAGGAVFRGIALCHKGACQNVIVSHEGPAGLGAEPESPLQIYWTALHELGHALGLGHATNLLESTDLMGYGWFIQGTGPVLSDCDVAALAYIWAWALEGTEPAPPGPGPYDCSKT